MMNWHVVLVVTLRGDSWCGWTPATSDLSVQWF